MALTTADEGRATSREIRRGSERTRRNVPYRRDDVRRGRRMRRAFAVTISLAAAANVMKETRREARSSHRVIECELTRGMAVAVQA